MPAQRDFGQGRAVRNYIIEKIKDKCEYSVDALGSVIAFKKGKKAPDKKVLVACAHRMKWDS